MAKLKEGVRFNGVEPEILEAMAKIAYVYRDDYDIDVTFTSLLDGRHMTNSLHYSGMAVDVRIWNLTPGQLLDIVERLEADLGPDYDVVLERTHIHVEYDPN